MVACLQEGEMMKTLDDIIKTCEECASISGHDLVDATQYLKEYKTRKLNNLLTKEELQKYKHKPVWIKWINNIWNGTCKWILITNINDYEITFSALDVAGQHYYGHLMFFNINKEWEAYEKEND